MSKSRRQKRLGEKHKEYLKKLILLYGNFYIKFGKSKAGIKGCATKAKELNRVWIRYCRKNDIKALDGTDPENMFLTKLREYEEAIKKNSGTSSG